MLYRKMIPVAALALAIDDRVVRASIGEQHAIAFAVFTAGAVAAGPKL